MFETKPMYLIYGCYGEYDDYNEIDILIVPNEDTARIMIDEYENHESIFFKKFEKWCGKVPSDMRFHYKEVPYFEI